MIQLSRTGNTTKLVVALLLGELLAPGAVHGFRAEDSPPSHKCGTHLVASPGTGVRELDSTTMELNDGESIFQARKESTIKSGVYNICLAPGAIAHVLRSEGGLVVRNLWENRSHHMRLVVNRVCFAIGPGEEIVISSDPSQLREIALSDGVLRRNPVVYELSNGANILHSQVLLGSVVRSSSVLRALMKSEGSEKQPAVRKILKMAACLSIATSGRGGFAYITE